MKTIDFAAAYESPNTEVYVLESESALLQASQTGTFSHNPFEDGGDVNF